MNKDIIPVLRNIFRGKVATKVRDEHDEVVVQYHKTDIVTFRNTDAELNSGGWVTRTTLKRINQALRAVMNSFSIGGSVSVIQRNNRWIICIENRHNEYQIPFTDGIRIDLTGEMDTAVICPTCEEEVPSLTEIGVCKKCEAHKVGVA